ncbi:MAG: hypothetical protein P9L90_06895 [Candidatus Aadella gelida]|nr:hypothetical protein [Candidatus Aadella gelida]
MRSEFNVGIKQPRRPSQTVLNKNIKKEPVIRQYLVLAEQIKQVLEGTPQRSMRSVAKWLGYSPARLSQIFKLTFLTPAIKEEILLTDNHKIFSITITSVCNIATEPSRGKQIEMWKKDLHDRSKL